MQKIAIISEPGINNFNYGNILQSYALNYYLNNNYQTIRAESLIFIDQNEKKRIRITFRTFLNFFKRFQKEKETFYDFGKRLKKSNDFINKNAKVRLIKNKELKESNYDIFIVGSDVVWTKFPNEVNKYKFLDFKTCKDFKKISYSVSLSRDYISKEENRKYLSKVLKEFNYISVREKSSLELLKTLGINNAYHTCDPTLLLSKKHWESLSKKVNINDKFIFVYLLGKDKKQREKIEILSKELNLKIVTIPHADGIYNEIDNDFGDYKLDNCSPEEWIYLINKAEYIITDSFHGLVFSTIFEKKFIVLKRYFTEDINNQIIDYLNTIDENDKYVDINNFNFDNLNWNYKKINNNLNMYINQSKKYFQEFVNKEYSLENFKAKMDETYKNVQDSSKTSTRKNFIYAFSYQILIVILPLITTPYIARILGSKNIGIYSYTYAIVYYFILFAMLGINNYGNREVAKNRDNEKKLSKTFIGIYSIQFITSLIMIILYILYVIFLVHENKYIALLQTTYLIGTMFDINWFFQGLEKFKLTITRNVIIKILTIICIFVFVKTRNDLYLYILIMSIGTLLSQVLLWPFLRKYVHFEKVSFHEVFRHLKPCLTLFVPTVAVSIYKSMDKIMLGNFTNMNEVGLYENVDKIMNVPIGLVMTLGTVMLPKMSNLIAKGNDEAKEKKYVDKSMKFILFITIPIVFGIIAIANDFIPLFLGTEFKKTGLILQVLIISLIPYACSNIIGRLYLIPHEKDHVYIIAVILGALANFIFNFNFIPIYHSVGAAIGTIIAETVVMIVYLYYVRKKLNILNYAKYFGIYMVKGIIMFLFVIALKYFIDNKFLLVGTQIIVGVIVYALINYKYVLTLLRRD